MKQRINLGAYGWLHPHWINSFYPEDLPEDWMLRYYSNEFITVLVPAAYWQTGQAGECEDWIDDVHADFQFYIECNGAMLDADSQAELSKVIEILKPQLSGLVFLEDKPISSQVKSVFHQLVSTHLPDIYGTDIGLEANKIWRPGEIQDDAASSVAADAQQCARFAFIDDDLTDLRSVRAMIEPFTMPFDCEKPYGTDAVISEATMIVNHPQLKASDLARLRSVLEIMGC